MQKRKLVEKHDGKIFISPHLELVEFLSDKQQGSQATGGFVHNHNMGRLDFIKFYGLEVFSQQDDRLIINVPNNDFWERSRDRERRVLSSIGQALYPKVPIPHEIGQWGDILYMTMSFGREAGIIDQRVTLEDFVHGNVLTLQQILTAHATGEKQKVIEKYRHASWQSKLSNFVELLSIVDTLHTSCGIIHNDIKPSQVLFISRDEQKPLIQLLDFGMHLEKDSPDSSLLGSPTTLMYNSPEMIRSLVQGLKGEHTRIPEGDELFFRDRYSLGVVGLQYVLGSAHPYFFKAKKILQKYYEKEKDISLERRIELQIQATSQAQEEYFAQRIHKDYAHRDITRNIPLQVEKKIVSMVHDTLDKNASISRDTEGLREYVKPLWTRRKFIVNSALALAAVATSATVVHKTSHYFSSSAYLRQEVLSESYSRNEIPKDALKNLVIQVYKKQIVPALNRSIETLSGNSILSVPVSVENSLYQLAETTRVVSGYMPRLLLFGIEKLGMDEFIPAYEKVLEIFCEQSPGIGFRSFRIIDPLVEVQAWKNKHSLSPTTLHLVDEKIHELADHLDKHFIEKAGGFYLIRPDLIGKEHSEYELSVASYYLVKYPQLLQQEKWRRHIHLLTTQLNENGLFPPAVRFSVDGDTIHNRYIFDADKQFSTYADSLFGAYAVHQAHMIDLFADVVVRGELAYTALFEKANKHYLENIRARGIHAPEYVFSNPSHKISDTRALKQNNMANAIRCATMGAHPQMFSNGDMQESFLHIITGLNVEGEGVLPESTLNPQFAKSCSIMSDFLTLWGCYEWVK